MYLSLLQIVGISGIRKINILAFLNKVTFKF